MVNCMVFKKIYSTLFIYILCTPVATFIPVTTLIPVTTRILLTTRIPVATFSPVQSGRDAYLKQRGVHKTYGDVHTKLYVDVV